jgi:hypothetical protein
MKHWKTHASPIVRRQIENLLAKPYRCTDGGLSWCEAWIQAAELCWSNEMDIDLPPSAATERIAELRAEKDFATLNDEYARLGLNWEAERESRALARWTARARKAALEPAA